MVYFDENPDDRLGENHDVDRSLHDKLKCLIFMPILSQTYCYTGSYAWQSELGAFIETARQDRLGMEIRSIAVLPLFNDNPDEENEYY